MPTTPETGSSYRRQLRKGVAKASLDSIARTAEYPVRTEPIRIVIRPFESGPQTETDETIPPDAPFGGEESYWTVFRMFASSRNVGKRWAADEIWEYLSLNYDLSNETRTSVLETIEEWEGDLTSDARERGISGALNRVDGGYVFTETLASHVARAERTVVEEISSPVLAARRQRSQEAAERFEIVRPLYERIVRLLQLTPELAMKQADLKKLVALQDDEIEVDNLQAQINELIRLGRLHKSRQGSAAKVSLAPQPDEPEEPTPITEERRERAIHSLDIPESVSVLETLTAPGTSLSRKFTLADLWRDAHDAATKSETGSDRELAHLKQTCRTLQQMGLVITSRRRAGAHHLFSVSLESMDMKRALQEELRSGHIDRYLVAEYQKLVDRYAQQ